MRISGTTFTFALGVVISFAAATAAKAGTITDLGTLGGSFSLANGLVSGATGINASGQVVGYSYTAGNAAELAFLYSGGVLTNLGTLGGSQSAASAINNAGQVVGQAYTTGNASADAFLYSAGVMIDLGAGPNSGATGINASGQVVGFDASGGFLYSGGVMTSLPTLGGSSSQPAGINDAGQVAGTSATAGDATTDA